MQKCNDCGASWDVNNILNKCPFCGANLRVKANVDSIEAAFKLIVERHGQDVFQNGTLLGLLGDYAPTLVKERKLVKIAIEAGAYKAICFASVAERKQILNKYTSLLMENYFIDEVWARKALMWYVNALDSDTNMIELEPKSEPDKDNGASLNADDSQSKIFSERSLGSLNTIIGKKALQKHTKSKREYQTYSEPHNREMVVEKIGTGETVVAKKNYSNSSDSTNGVNIIPVGATSASGLLKRKKSIILAKNLFDIKEVSKQECENPIELPNAKFERYCFDLIAKGYIRDVEYFLVTQPGIVKNTEKLFIFKNPSGTANPPIFIPDGKQVKKLYNEFKKIFAARFNFVEQ